MFITTIPFSGFYGTAHDYMIDAAVEQIFENGEGMLNTQLFHSVFDDIDFRKIQIEYAKYYVKKLSSLLGLDLKFYKIDSPREYNFETDIVNCVITESTLKNIVFRAVADRGEFDKVCQAALTPYDGFCPFYSADWREWGHVTTWEPVQVGLALQALINIEEDEEFLFYIMADASGDGVLADIVYDSLGQKAKRAVRVSDYLRARAERDL